MTHQITHLRIYINLKSEFAKAYANDKFLVSPKSVSLFHTPLHERLQHQCTQLQKWLETVRQAKKSHTLTIITRQIKMAYTYGRNTISTMFKPLFRLSLREQLRTSIANQTKWMANYNKALTYSASTLHHYYNTTGRPPGTVPNRALQLWATQNTHATPNQNIHIMWILCMCTLRIGHIPLQPISQFLPPSPLPHLGVARTRTRQHL